VLAGGLLVAPAASAAGLGAVPLGLSILGVHIGIHIPSVGDIVHAIVNLFFGTLANALVPEFLRHATVSVIQHLVAVPDPAAWPNVGRLVGDMIYLAASLLPVMLTVAVLRYWAVGFTGAAHPANALRWVGWCSTRGGSGSWSAWSTCSPMRSSASPPSPTAWDGWSA
jgi:hypothetical protein